jgi:hypothetical protein
MTSLALILLLIARVIVPFVILITLGELTRQRELKYWFRM